MAEYHLSNGQRLKIGNSFLIFPEENIPEVPLHPTEPVLPNNLTTFNYDDLKNIALSLIQQFGVTITIHTTNKTVNPDTPWDRTNEEVSFVGHAVKLTLSSYDREIDSDRKEVRAKFLIGTESLVRVDDWFTFTDSKYTIVSLNRLDPGGIILAYEALCV